MKTQQTKYLATLLLIITLINCSSDDNTPTNPIDQLPPITQNGSNKVGCLVNGEVFLPKGSNPLGPPIVTCFYQFVNNEWHFSLGFSNNQQQHLRGINVASHGVELEEGSTYNLVLNDGNNAFGEYTIYMGGISDINKYSTNTIIVGKLIIDNLDAINLIISGTFWFDAINSNNEIIEIREGRFDMEYTP